MVGPRKASVRMDAGDSPRLRFALAYGAAAALGAMFTAVALSSFGAADPRAFRPIVVATPSGSRIFAGDVVVDLRRGTALLLSGDERRGLTLNLDRGRIECVVPPLPGRRPLLVRAGTARLRGHGTRFTVSRVDEAVTVAVHRGVVETVSREAPVVLRSGDTWAAPAVARSPRADGRSPPGANAPDARVLLARMP